MMISLFGLALSLAAGAVELEAPTRVIAGSSFQVRWTGVAEDQDYITIVPANAADGKYAAYVYVSWGNPVTLRAPDATGEYELRYQSDSRQGVLGRRPIEVTGAEVSLSAAGTALAGSGISVTWTGPNNAGDYITIVAADAPDKTWKDYGYTSEGSPLTVRAPDEPGAYEIRYGSGQSYATLAAIPIMVVGAEVTVEVAASAMAGSPIAVAWTGPDNQGDYITIVPVGTPEKRWEAYEFTSWGSPLQISTSDRPGEYEVRYITGQSDTTLGRAPITLDPASAALEGPESVVAGDAFEVAWEGPGNPNDFVTIVPAGAAEGTWTHYAGVHWGNPVTLTAPRSEGDHELRYVTGASHTTLARRPVTVTPGTDPARLRVRRAAVAGSPGVAPVVALILDASGSMLKRDHGETRIGIARRALLQLVDESLPDDALVMLRVFGHKEPNSCRTDLEIPLGALDRTMARTALTGVQAQNLAKTPIGASLAELPDDLAGAEGQVTVVLVTDGEETCGGDPARAIEDLEASGYEVQVNIIGFAIDDVMLKETFRQWARLGSGRYVDAANFEELSRGLLETLDPRFEVIDSAGNQVVLGTVNGEAIELPAGAYIVRLVDAAESTAHRIELSAGEALTLDL